MKSQNGRMFDLTFQSETFFFFLIASTLRFKALVT